MPKVDFESIKPEFFKDGELGPMEVVYEGSVLVAQLVKYPQAAQAAPRHQHPEEQIIYMLKGSAEAHVGDEVFMVEPGSVVHHPPNTDHHWIPLTDIEFLSVKNGYSVY